MTFLRELTAEAILYIQWRSEKEFLKVPLMISSITNTRLLEW